MGRPKSNRICDIPGCGLKHHATGLCEKHYARSYYARPVGREAVARAKRKYLQTEKGRFKNRLKTQRYRAKKEGHRWTLRNSQVACKWCSVVQRIDGSNALDACPGPKLCRLRK